VPTWCPFRLQVYFNGHGWLAAQLAKRGIGFTLMDNAFSAIADWKRAQQIADGLEVETVHRLLDKFARKFCPVIRYFTVDYHWSIGQAEYATDIVFRRQTDLEPIYESLSRTAIHAVKPDNVATFLGRKLHGNYQDEVGNDFHTRIEGTRIKHCMGPVSVKMYDKFHLILRIETTTNNVSFFKHYRQVEHRGQNRSHTKHFAWAAMKKSIYSLEPLRQVLAAVNQRYLEFISTLDDCSSGIPQLRKLSRTVVDHERSYSGFNLFDEEDHTLFETIARGEFNIRGFQNKYLRQHLREKTGAQTSRLLKRLRLHGLIKKVRGTYRYYLTTFGRRVTSAGLQLKQLFLVPQLAAATAP